MDIAAMSMQMSSASLQQSVGLSVARKAMDNQEVQAEGLMDMLDAADPQVQASGLGQVVDVMA